jgi:plasmid maintenance system antidote protein VapI
VIDDAPQYRLRSPDLLRQLMQHTGTGDKVTIRELARAAGIHHSTVGELVKGDQETTNYAAAQRLSARIGVDLLVLWIPAQRADAAMAEMSAA